MGLLSGITDAIGLTNVSGMESAANAATQSTMPWDLYTSYGSVTRGAPGMGGTGSASLFGGGIGAAPGGRALTTNVDPRWTDYQNSLFSQMGSISPDEQLALMRQQAAPYNEAASLGLENRLFSQGRLDHSQPYQAGGAMRGLWDAQLNQDLSFQQQAQQQAWQREQQLLGSLLSSYGPEQALLAQSFGGGAAAGQGGMQGAQILSQSAMQMPNLMSSLLGGATMGWAMGGFGGLGGGGGGGFTGHALHGY